MSKILLLEGADDDHSIRAIKGQHHITKELFEHVNCDGVENLLDKNLRNALKSDSVHTIGIVLDADTDLNARWNALKAKLIDHVDLPIPFPKEGLVIQGKYKRIGVWIMPNNQVNGMLEDFLAELVPADDPLLPIAKETLATIESRGLNKYSSIHQSKALMHTWLAWQEQPGRPFGQAITNHSLTTNPELCQRFIAWLKLLFLEPTITP
jgi:hypothetical protein